MALSHSPLIVTDGLVFMYDTGNRKSYKGEPTTNLTTDSPSQGGWNGSLNVLDSSTKKFRFNVSNFSGSPGQGWRSFTWDLNSYSGQSVTISATVEVPSASPGTFAWIMMGQGNTHTNTSGAGGYMGYSAASERIQKTTTTTEHITWSGTVGSTGTASQPSGHVGFTVWYNDGTPSTNSYVEVSNVQIEIKSHATQFVNGTRSATQGLLDLTNNTTINLSNASFDSNAQMVFDGTDDTASVASHSGIEIVDNVSIEYVYKRLSTDSVLDVIANKYHGTGWELFCTTGNKFSLAGRNGDGTYYSTGNSGQTMVNNKFYHLVAIKEGTSWRLYVNGELDSSTTANTVGTWSNNGILQIGGEGTGYYPNMELPVLKIYNKALTAAEVLQNYNATKGRFS